MKNGKTPWLPVAIFAAGSSLFLLKRVPKVLGGAIIKDIGNRLVKDPYVENLWELISATKRVSPQTLIENSLRSECGQPLKRPLGSPKRIIDFDGLVFNIAQMATEPYGGIVDTSVVIGPQAQHPLKLQTPLMVSGMAYGLALSQRAKLALAKGAAAAGTATNSGESGFWMRERKATRYYIVQYHRGQWNKNLDWCKYADMLEIQIGQGASAGTPHVSKGKDLKGSAQRFLGLNKGENAFIAAGHDMVDKPADLRALVDLLREKGGGVPVGIKMGGSNQLEEDMEIAVEAGVDFIALDGGEAATVGSEPILQDGFGLPTLIALSRGARFLEERGLKGRISLIIGGGLYHPEHFLKAMALGADGIYLGSVCLFAIAHQQIFLPLPWEPPTTLVYYTGRYKKRLNVKKAAQGLTNFLKACTAEMAIGVQALGKDSLRAVDKHDLVCLDERTAQITGVKLAWEPNGQSVKEYLPPPHEGIPST
ncbi:MAG: FMN-binding glutamate synthase family protein [Limnochordia bacterium]